MTVVDSPTRHSDRRLPITVALLGGAALLLLGQLTQARRPETERWPVYGLMALGALVFTFGLRLSAMTRIPAGLVRPVRSVARYLGITPGQLVLLGLAPCLAGLARLAAGNGLLAYQATVATVAWLLAGLAVIAGSYRADGGLGKIGRREILLIAVLFAAAFVLRGWATQRIPTTLSGDEASGGLSAVNFLQGRANNLFSIGWFSFPSLFYGLESVSIRLFGQTIEALRLVSALAGALTVVGLYGLVRALFDRPTALLAAALLMAAHFHIHFSRIGLQNIWDGLFTTLALAGLWRGWKTGRRANFLLCGLALGLGQYFYISFRAMPALLLVWTLSMALFQRPTFRQRLPDLILVAWIASILFLPLGLYFLDNPQEFSAPLQRVSIFNGWLDKEITLTGQARVTILWRQLAQSALGITHVPLKHWYTPGTPLLLPAAAAFFWLGLLWAVNTWDARHWLMLLPILGVIAAGALSQDPPASQRYVVVSTLAPFFIALPLAQGARWIARAWPRYGWAVYGGAALMVVWLMWADLRLYFVDLPKTYVLGGINTQTAMFIVDYLETQPEPAPIYFFGWPRMGYYSIASIAYLQPEFSAEDLMQPLTAPPNWELTGPTLFMFLPERGNELDWVAQSYPGGQTQTIQRSDGQAMFIVYEVTP